MALGHYNQEGKCGTTLIFDETADISHPVVFSFYDWVWFILPKESKIDRMTLGRWLGPSLDVGEALTYAILMPTAEVVHRSSVLPLTVEEKNSEETKMLKSKFGVGVTESRLGDGTKGFTVRDNNDEFSKYMEEEIPHFEPYDDEETHETDDAERPRVSPGSVR